MREINSIWDVWTENFHDAKRFFESKGNIKTRIRLKKQWCDNLHKRYGGRNMTKWKEIFRGEGWAVKHKPKYIRDYFEIGMFLNPLKHFPSRKVRVIVLEEVKDE